MNYPLKLVASCLLLLVSLRGGSQVLGGFPPSTRWKQINTDTVRVIFTKPASQVAKRVVSLIERMAADTPVPLGKKLTKITIILHNNTTLANGYVALAPRRSEYYLIPGSNNFEFGNLPWYENLAVHEYRHVQQFNNFNHGISHLFSFLFGQQGQLFANSIAVPDWFFEGDAVYAETAFTGLGRGHQPLFTNTYKSLWLDQKTYSWMKLRNGSYKDFVPNHYYLGYLLVNYGYLKYGPSFWRQVTHRATGFEGIVYPFQHAVYKETGQRFRNFYKEAVSYYQNQTANHTPPKERTKAFTNFYFPQQLGKDSIIFLRETFKQRPTFYIQTIGGKYPVREKDISTETAFAYRQGWVVYTAYRPDPRWNLIDYNNLILADIHSGKKIKLTHKGKYYTPDLSPNGKTVMAVSVNDSLKTEIHLLDVRTGRLVQKIVPGINEYFVQPKFIDNDNILLGIRTYDGTMSLNTLELRSGVRSALTAWQPFAMGDFSLSRDTVYFTASYPGNDELFALDIRTRNVYQLTQSETGNYFPAVHGNDITWSVFTAKGYQMQSAQLTGMAWKPVDFSVTNVPGLPYPVADAHAALLATPTRDFREGRFSKSNGLINIHSWNPALLAIYSNNILNTLSLQLSYTPNYTDRSGTVTMAAAYGGFFPVIQFQVDHLMHKQVIVGSGQFTIHQTETQLGYYIPLNFTDGLTSKTLSFGSGFIYTQAGSMNKNVRFRNLSYLSHFVSWYHALATARQQVYPRLGYSISSTFRHELDRKGSQFNGDLTLYFPGLSPNHNLIFTANYQRIDTANLLFSPTNKLARGYRGYIFPRMFTPSINYHLPIAYPDWGVANILYCSRIRANFFFDRSYVAGPAGFKNHFSSAGVNLLMDTRWVNALDATLGVQYSHLFNARYAGGFQNVWDFTLGLPFY